MTFSATSKRVFLIFSMLYAPILSAKLIQSNDEMSSKTIGSQSSSVFKDMVFMDSAGMSHTLESWSQAHGGKPILLIAWASWCGPCLRELPTVNALQDSDFGQKIEILPIAIEAPVSGHVYSLENISMPLFYSDTLAAFMSVEGITGIPAAFLYAPDGRLLLSDSGARNWNSPRSHLKIEKALRTVIAHSHKHKKKMAPSAGSSKKGKKKS